jgi:hypothetical protein
VSTHDGGGQPLLCPHVAKVRAHGHECLRSLSADGERGKHVVTIDGLLGPDGVWSESVVVRMESTIHV